MRLKGDLKMRVRVEVTKNDIRRGRCGDCSNCPIARAVKRATKIQNVNVDEDSISISNDGQSLYIDSSQKCTRFVQKFDSGEKVKPIVFLINVPKAILTK